MNREEYIANLNYAKELYHHGVKGQKWGVRRYQNADGSLTSAGKDKYGKHIGSDGKLDRRTQKKLDNRMWKDDRKQYLNNNSNAGKAAAKFILLGATGSHAYNSLRAQGTDRSTALGRTLVPRLLLTPIGGAAVNAVQSSMAKSDARDSYDKHRKSKYKQYTPTEASRR